MFLPCIVARALELGDSVSCEPLQPVGSNLEHLNLGYVAWQPHDLDWFNLNTDSSMVVQHGIVAYGAVVWNNKGSVMMAGGDVGVYFDDVNIPEAEASRFGLWIASEIGLSLLIVKSNSLRITQFVLGHRSICTELFSIVTEVQLLLLIKQNFRLWHISKTCNQQRMRWPNLYFVIVICLQRWKNFHHI